VVSNSLSPESKESYSPVQPHLIPERLHTIREEVFEEELDFTLPTVKSGVR
jgi:hypothetical protein